ncbi:hypothetical protein [Brevibacillus fulvus]|uniref:Uncharacterized protein n=1 Tax=Brevibacillus fulvus TaxID=1125967 RepID=A0A938XYR4_9BACL|nr:hypothetical protein [Brevibacillus fulvus]MBM7589364.1 hypothetical protein [Brevibacillus fulvus]
MKKTDSIWDKVLWSIAIPGFGQYLNGQYVKGTVLLVLEFLINSNARLNTIILLSFQGKIAEALDSTNLQWLMFYPCVYMYGIWDAYYVASGGKTEHSVYPFVLAAYFGTVGIIYAPVFRIQGTLLGPVWLPMITAGMGIAIGLLLKHFLLRFSRQEKKEPSESESP